MASSKPPKNAPAAAAAALPKFADLKTTLALVSRHEGEFAIVRNPSYVFPPFDAYPLAPKITRFRKGLVGIVKDMDGTTTTTELLCLHSLEMMVRRITNRESVAAWRGLDPVVDFPNVIGNSTTRHVEYLIATYGAGVDAASIRRHFVEAAAWTLLRGQDPGRRVEVRVDLNALGAAGFETHPAYKQLAEMVAKRGWVATEAARPLAALTKTFAPKLRIDSTSEVVRAAIDIYYYRYHEILEGIEAGQGESLSRELLGRADRHLIEPMPGVALFLALVRGWLGGADAAKTPALLALALEHAARNQAAHAHESHESQATAGNSTKSAKRQAAKSNRAAASPQLVTRNSSLARSPDALPAIAKYFAANPLRVAVVTSSIYYEARIVLREVFRVLRSEVEAWPVSAATRRRILAGIESPDAYYDAIVTASDSSEIRLKPHRDLYCIALHRLGIATADFDKVIGLEDSESGTIAIRAAGIGCSVAVPFAQSSGHNLSAASVLARGGLPEVIGAHGMFLDPKLLK